MPGAHMPTRVLFAALAFLVAAAPAEAGQSELVIHTQGTGLYHRPGCPLLKDATDVMAMTRAQAEARGHKPTPTAIRTRRRPRACRGRARLPRL